MLYGSLVRGLVVVQTEELGRTRPGDPEIRKLSYLEFSLEGDVVAPYFLWQELPLEIGYNVPNYRPERWC